MVFSAAVRVRAQRSTWGCRLASPSAWNAGARFLVGAAGALARENKFNRSTRFLGTCVGTRNYRQKVQQIG